MRPMKVSLVLLLAIAHVASAAVDAPGGREVAATPQANDVMPSHAPQYPPPVPLLWKVSDHDNAIYLLGSFHLLKDSDYPLSTDIDEAFGAVDKLVFEIAPEQLDDPATGQQFLAAAAYDNGQTLSDVLPPRLREKLHRLMARQGGTIAQVDAYEPWFVNLSLLMGLAQSLGFTAELGLDRHLMARAEAAGKPAGGLETFEDQLQALDSTPITEQVIGLKDFLDNPQEMPGMLGELHQAWRDGDVAELDQLTRLEMQKTTPETYRIVNVERNDAWLPQLQAMLDDNRRDDIMVVVGALHLLGDDGVVEKLRDEGYAVERICSACDAVVAD